jgi:hypothetical protein
VDKLEALKRVKVGDTIMATGLARATSRFTTWWSCHPASRTSRNPNEEEDGAVPHVRASLFVPLFGFDFQIHAPMPISK